MKPDFSEGYWNIISRYYDSLKDGIDAESKKSYGVPVDEDLLHDTFIKCVDSVKDKDIGLRGFLNYVFISYKRNYIRDREYARNKIVDKVDDFDENIASEPMKETIDYDNFMKMVEDRFGKEDCELFEKFVYGDKISDLERDYNKKGLYYKFKKIKDYLKDIIDKQ